MTTPDLPFDEGDVSTWTYERVKLHVESSRYKVKSFYMIFFGWSMKEYKEAKESAVAKMRKYIDPTDQFPTTGPQAKHRHTVQINLVRDRPDLFVNRHEPLPPAWFNAELISRSPSLSHTKAFDLKNVVQQFITFCRPHRSERERQRKRQDRAEEVADDDEEDDDGCRVMNKRPRISCPGASTPLSNTTSITMPGSPSATMPSSRRSAGTQQSSIGPALSWNKKIQSRVSTGSSMVRVENHTSLTLYITRVTIVDQTLVLERDRLGIVDNLFERGRLVESYIQELVFGNPLDDKPTFLWYFDDTSDDKPRCIRNRPSAEAAIMMLREQAERAGATGIQLFDAPDCDTAALVPVHEVTRKNDFVQRASFELEVDNEENDDDDDDMEEAEKASKVDSAYGSRDGELQLNDVTSEREPQLDNVAVKEEIESGPNITWAGEQQENKVESKSESESDEDEDEDIGGFYR